MEDSIAKFSKWMIPMTTKLSKRLAHRLPSWRIEQVREAAIRHRAYFLWEYAGRPPGRAMEFWLAGEKQYEMENQRFWGLFSEAALPRHPEPRTTEVYRYPGQEIPRCPEPPTTEVYRYPVDTSSEGTTWDLHHGWNGLDA